MEHQFQSSAAVPLPSIKFTMTAQRSGSAGNNSRRRAAGGTSNAKVAASVEALQRACDFQRRQQMQQDRDSPEPSTLQERLSSSQQRQQQQHHQQQGQHPSAQERNAAALLMKKRQQSASSSSPAAGAVAGSQKSILVSKFRSLGATALEAVTIGASGGGVNSPVAMAMGATASSSGGGGAAAAAIGGRQFLPLSSELFGSEAVLRCKNETDPRYSSGYSAFEFALETAMNRLRNPNATHAAATSSSSPPGGGDHNDPRRRQNTDDEQQQQHQQQQNQDHQRHHHEMPVEERWRVLADCLTSGHLHEDLHRVCRDVEATMDELTRARAFSIVRAERAGGSNSPMRRAISNMLSPGAASRLGHRARINGTQTATAAMLLEQCLAALGSAAPYSRPALKWLLDSILGSIYVSYDIVANDLSRSFEQLHLARPQEPSGSSAAGGGGDQSNAERLIQRFYGKTYFQSVRSLSTVARAHADHAEELERAKTRQSRVLERAISYWARYSMRRVLGAWRGFAKNEKIERQLRGEVEELRLANSVLKEINEQRERDTELTADLSGASAESLQLQVRELQRALEFERRRATRAEAALAVRIVDEGGDVGGAADEARFPGGGSSSSANLRSQESVDAAALRADIAHYRAVAVEACRLGDIDLHELERAVSAQTNILARGNT